MVTDNDFSEVGKRNIYPVPEGFFERITEETLITARQRDLHRKRSVQLWKRVGLVASLALLVTLGFLIKKGYDPTDANADQAHVVKRLVHPSPAEEEQGVPHNLNQEIATERGITDDAGLENEEYTDFDEFLTSLTDEDLCQLAEQSDADFFASTIINN